MPLALITTVYRAMSHSYHIAGRFLHGYSREGRFHTPRQFIQSMYVDQFPVNDMAREIAREHGIRSASSIAEALTEGSRLAVGGVLLIGEHGNYPRNDRGQILYPRYDMLEQVVAVFRATGQVAPVFCDRHLSYSWEKSREMYGWARELDFPFQAGSSLPVTWRRPELELPWGCSIAEALVAGYGPIEGNGFDALEALQAMVERRADGESGVKAVTCVSGRDVWKAGDAGKWSWELLEAALSRSETLNPGDARRNVGTPPALPAVAFLVEYRDGLRGTVLLLNGHIQDFCFAAQPRGGGPALSCMFRVPPPPGAKSLDCLVGQLETLFETGRPGSPPERALLTSGMLAAAMESRYRRGSRIETPELDIHYEAPTDSHFCRGEPAMSVM
jgi:hypothetical protein